MGQQKKFTVKREQSADKLRKDALRRLKDRWEEEHEGEEWCPEKEPVVSPMFRDFEGGTAAVIEAIRAHNDDDAQAFIEAYDGVSSSDRRLLSLETIAFSAGVSALRLAEVAQTATYLYASMTTKFLISGAMPKVTRSIIKAATDEIPITARNPFSGDSEVVGHTNGDVKAMELFGRISGIAPVPKGATIAIQNNYGERDEKPTGPTWRTAEDRLREIQDAIEPKRLPSPVVPPISIGGHIDSMQAQTVEILRGE
jgi:hypothetical protein